ncbi:MULTISPECIES: AAA family ATPase [unclassified Bradyrhizobium]
MIKELALTNFKCFANQKIPMGSLTLLSGLNGMGKSSVIQSLLVLRQSFQSGILARGALLTSGPLVDLGSVSDVLFERAKEDSLAIELLFDKPKFAFSPKTYASFSFSVISGDRLLGEQANIEAAIDRVKAQPNQSIFSDNLRQEHIGNFQ